MFIMIDGIDGSGKSTVMEAYAAHLEEMGKKVFFLKPFWLAHGRHPRPEELDGYEAVISAEPTSVGIGKHIRDVLIREGNATTRALAEAFAADRMVLYKTLLIPLRDAGMLILQDRGISSSLCYQPIHDPSLTPGWVAGLPGNAFALAHAPDHLIIVDAAPEEAIKRLSGRAKQDYAVFEKEQFLRQARARFLDPDFQRYFTAAGAAVHILNGGAPLAIMQQEAVGLLNTLL
jgi:thymidylate kinase